MKKIALLLVFAMLIALFPTEVWAAGAEYYPACSPSQTSLVDGLAEVGCTDTSFANRALIAQINGIASVDSYAGSPEENQQLLSLLKEGRLLKEQGNTSDTSETAMVASGNSYFPACGPSQTSLVDGLAEVGCSDTSFDFRSKIAVENGISDYSGSADQNNLLLEKLKAGQLIKSNNNGSAAGTIPASSSMVSNKSPKAEGTICEIVSDAAALRTDASQRSEIITYLPRGSILTITKRVINKAGNAWCVCMVGETTAYIYESHLTAHTCVFEEREDNFYVCKCGQYKITQSGMQATSATAVAGTLLGGDVMAGAAALGGFAETASAVASAAFPYVAVAVVGGMLIYMAVNCTGTQIGELSTVKLSSVEDVEDFISDDDAQKPYHKAATLFGTGGLLVEKDGMTLEEANKFLKGICNNFLYGTFRQTTQNSFLSTWCMSITAATNLAQRFEKNGPYYSYGDSDHGLGHDPAHNDVYASYEHYHLFGRLYPSGRIAKVCDTHIFFGFPISSAASVA